jgi:hypothetical protein
MALYADDIKRSTHRWNVLSHTDRVEKIGLACDSSREVCKNMYIFLSQSPCQYCTQLDLYKSPSMKERITNRIWSKGSNRKVGLQNSAFPVNTSQFPREAPLSLAFFHITTGLRVLKLRTRYHDFRRKT